MAPFTQLDSKVDFDSYITTATGKSVLVAYMPGDPTSDAMIAALKANLPKKSYADFGITNIYCFDGYALPDLAAELCISSVPALLWFTDGVMDAYVWHQGVAVRGETTEKAVERLIDRIKGANIHHADDQDDW